MCALQAGIVKTRACHKTRRTDIPLLNTRVLVQGYGYNILIPTYLELP